MTLDLTAIQARVNLTPDELQDIQVKCAAEGLARPIGRLLAARSDIPALIREVQALRSRLATVTGERDELRGLLAIATDTNAAQEKLVEPGEPHGEPTVKLATLLSTAKRVTRAEAEVARMREALERIRDLDYRGNRHESAGIARAALGGSNG